MAKLTFYIRPSPETNDHEVRVLVDGHDVLGNDHMGVDPEAFFAQFSNPDSNRLMIGRCGCGVVGCDDDIVLVERNAKEITWRGRENWHFSRDHYEAAIQRASNDFSWEDELRRAERISSEVLQGCQTEDGFLFEWTSARIASKLIMASFRRDGQQKMLEFIWDEATDESAKHGAECLKKQLAVD